LGERRLDAERGQLCITLFLDGETGVIDVDTQLAQCAAGGLVVDDQREEQVVDVGFAEPEPGCLLHCGQRRRVAGLSGADEFVHLFLLGVEIAGSIRLECFLWAACRVTPSASAISCQLMPERNAASTCRSSKVSASTRKDATARNPVFGSLVSAATAAILGDSMLSTYVAKRQVVNLGCFPAR